MSRWLILAYSVASYAMFQLVVVYSILFLGNLYLARTLDSSPRIDFWPALGINGLLLALFSLQHSGMARPKFKQWLTRYLPEAMERSTYVLLSNLAMILIFAFWQPLGGIVWSMESTLLRGLAYGFYFLGWGVLFASTFSIDHFSLFGLRQAWCHFRGIECTPSPFKIPFPYNLVRHPIYVGWLMIFWAAPTMTVSHLVFAIGTTAYILFAIVLEERDLIQTFGRSYEDYRKQVPMLIPWKRHNSAEAGLAQNQDFASHEVRMTTVHDRPRARQESGIS